jgi:O-antigen ligase
VQRQSAEQIVEQLLALPAQTQVVLLAPWVTPVILALPHAQDAMPLSWRMRGEIWRFARDRIGERPLTGWGLDGARQFGSQILTIDGVPFQAIPLHPHSFSVHVWLETGAVGAVLMASAIFAGGVAASRTLGASRYAAAAVCGVMASAGLIWNVSYGAWQEWWIGAVFVALAAAAVVRR